MILQTVWATIKAGWGHVLTRRPRRYSRRRYVRRIIGAVILLVLLLSSSCFLWYQLSDERIRVRTIQAVESLTGGEVELEEASLSVLRQIRIKGLKIYLPGRAHSGDSEIFSAADVILEHNPASLLLRQLHIRKIIADKAKLSINYDLDKRITNLQWLSFLKGTSTTGDRPEIYLRDAIIEYREYRKGVYSSPIYQAITGRFVPHRGNNQEYDFLVSGDERGLAGRTSIRGIYNLRTKRLTMSGRLLLQNLKINNLPGRFATWSKWFRKIQPRGVVEFIAVFDASTGHELKVSMVDGQLNIPLRQSSQVVPLQEVAVELEVTDEGVDIRKLRGRNKNGMELILSGKLMGYSRQSRFHLNFRTANLSVPTDMWEYLPLTEEGEQETLPVAASGRWQGDAYHVMLAGVYADLPLIARKFMRWFKWTNRFDVELELEGRLDKPKDIICNGRFICRDVQMCYEHFPYPVSAVKGEISFGPNRVDIGPLETHIKNSSAVILGKYRKIDEKDNLDVTVTVKNMELNDMLYNALDPNSQQLWREFSPTGAVNAVFRYKERGKKHRSQNLDVELLDVQATYRGFPLPLEDIRGQGQWDKQNIVFRIDHARAAEGLLKLEGTVANLNLDDEQVDCRVQFSHLKLDKNFARCLRGHFRSSFEQLNMDAFVDGEGRFWGKLRTAGEKGGVKPVPLEDNLLDRINYRMNFKLQEGSLKYAKVPLRLEGVEAEGELTNQQLVLKSLRGRQGKGQVSLDGMFRSEKEYDFRVQCRRLALSATLRDILPDKEAGLWEEFKPAGEVNLDMALQAGNGQSAGYRVIIEPLGCRAKLPGIDYPLEDIKGRIEVIPNRISIKQLSSRTDGASLKVVGEMSYGDKSSKIDLYIQGDNFVLNRKLHDRLWRQVRAIWDEYKPEGKLDFNLDAVYDQAEGQDPIWNISGLAAWAGGAIRNPVEVRGIQGQLQGKAQYNVKKGALDLTGTLDCARLEILRRPFSNITAGVEYKGEKGILSIIDINGGFCGGRLAGELQINKKSGSKGYMAALQCLDVDLAGFMRTGGQSDDKIRLKGKLNGWLNMVKEAGQPRRGVYLFKVHDAVLGQLPLTAQLLHVINLKFPQEGAFNSADIRGDIIGDKARFHDIRLRGSAVSLSGAGFMNGPFLQAPGNNGQNNSQNRKEQSASRTRGPLSLIFVVDAPKYVSGIPILASFYKAIRREIMQLRVSGSFYKPKVESVAFPSIGEALKQLEGRADRN